MWAVLDGRPRVLVLELTLVVETRGGRDDDDEEEDEDEEREASEENSILAKHANMEEKMHSSKLSCSDMF